jgi:uncharacterized membrane protein YbhN (UPF0104 family)
MKIHSQVNPDAEALKGKPPLWRRLFNLAILAILVVLAVRYVDFSQVWELITSADWRYVLLVLALATTSRFLMAWKWHRLLTAANVPAGFDSALGAYYRGSMVSQVPFMVIGADLLRIHWIGSHLGKRAVVAATVVMEKALGLISAFFLGTLGLSVILAAHRAEEQNITLGVVGLLGLGASLLLLILSLQEGLHLRLLRIVERLAPRRFGSVLERLSVAYRLVGGKRWTVFQVQVLTLVEHIVQFLMLYFSGRAVGVELELPLFLAGISVAAMMRRVAIYVEGWGLAQAATVLVLTFLGISVEQSLSLSLLSDAMAIVASLPGFVLLVRDAFASQTVSLGDTSGEE